MLNLTKIFQKEAYELTRTAAATLLRVDSCVLHSGNAMLAGGWVRDVYFGVKPKDMDFAFWNMSPEQLFAVMRQYRDRSPYPISFEEFASDYNGGDSNLLTVFKLTEHRPDGDVQIDWILYGASTRDEVLGMFDHSINAFFMEYSDEFELTVGYVGEWGVCTRNPGVKCSDERADRMREMARIVDWEYRDDGQSTGT
jgi:hypothetical protein